RQPSGSADRASLSAEAVALSMHSPKRLALPVCLLPTEYVAFPTRIGAAAQRARFRVDADGDDARAHGVGTEHAEHVAARSQVVEHLRRHASFDLEQIGRAHVVVERAVRVIRVEAWRLD